MELLKPSFYPIVFLFCLGYLLSAPFWGLTYVFTKKRWQEAWSGFFAWNRYLFLLLTVVFLINCIFHYALNWDFFYSYWFGERYEEWAFSRRYLLYERLFPELITLLFWGLLPLLLFVPWFKKAAPSTWLMLLLSALGCFSESLFRLFYSNQSDYLPSSWVIYWHWTETVLPIAVFGVLHVLTRHFFPVLRGMYLRIYNG